MKINQTYRNIARIVAVALLFGVVTPSILQASMLMHCETMMDITTESQSSMHDHDSMSHNSMVMDSEKEMDSDVNCCTSPETMDHQKKNGNKVLSHCETALECNCDLDDKAFHNDAIILHTFKIPAYSLSETISDYFEDYREPSPIPIIFSNSYSPPLLFLANESFLI